MRLSATARHGVVTRQPFAQPPHLHPDHRVDGGIEIAGDAAEHFRADGEFIERRGQPVERSRDQEGQQGGHARGLDEERARQHALEQLPARIVLHGQCAGLDDIVTTCVHCGSSQDRDLGKHSGVPGRTLTSRDHPDLPNTLRLQVLDFHRLWCVPGLRWRTLAAFTMRVARPLRAWHGCARPSHPSRTAW